MIYVAGDDIAAGQLVRLCRIDGLVYPVRRRPPRRRPWPPFGMAEADAQLAGSVRVLRSGYCYMRTPAGEVASMGTPIPLPDFLRRACFDE